jgi:adenosylmethionine-8-amino-7-oxononanoate aminotransferase
LDHKYLWHPFTQMRDWLKREPIVLVRGRGTVLEDVHGRKYLDANSSIWTNLHGHHHPKLNAAIGRQLNKIAHTSALGFANEPASLLSQKLVEAANPSSLAKSKANPDLKSGSRRLENQKSKLSKVFFSDDGSTAVEVALKLAHEFTRRTRGQKQPRFLSLEGAYHGDTVGAVALGHIKLFHKAYSGLLFKTDHVMAPYCYRCPYNRTKPERADARAYRKCNWECVDKLDQKLRSKKKSGAPYAGFVVEPLMQGAAGMIPQPPGWLRRAAKLVRDHGACLIADEVMTGFGRTGFSPTSTNSGSIDTSAETFLFACHHEGVQPDFLCVAKGITGGYLPMGATLTTQPVFHAFLGEYEEFKTFFHGHSYTGNQLAAAAGLASLQILQSPASLRGRRRLQQSLTDALQSLWRHAAVGDIRQVGLVAGIELVKDWRTRRPFPLAERAGIRVCDRMAKLGVLTRPIGNIIVIMPPYCSTPVQVHQMVQTLSNSIAAEFE